MRKVEFIKNYSAKKKGEAGNYDSLLASYLVHKAKVAKYFVEKPKKVNKKK